MKGSALYLAASLRCKGVRKMWITNQVGLVLTDCWGPDGSVPERMKSLNDRAEMTGWLCVGLV